MGMEKQTVVDAMINEEVRKQRYMERKLVPGYVWVCLAMYLGGQGLYYTWETFYGIHYYFAVTSKYRDRPQP